jgi:hypothetical protein
VFTGGNNVTATLKAVVILAVLVGFATGLAARGRTPDELLNTVVAAHQNLARQQVLDVTVRDNRVGTDTLVSLRWKRVILAKSSPVGGPVPASVTTSIDPLIGTVLLALVFEHLPELLGIVAAVLAWTCACHSPVSRATPKNKDFNREERELVTLRCYSTRSIHSQSTHRTTDRGHRTPRRDEATGAKTPSAATSSTVSHRASGLHLRAVIHSYANWRYVLWARLIAAEVR